MSFRTVRLLQVSKQSEVKKMSVNMGDLEEELNRLKLNLDSLNKSINNSATRKKHLEHSIEVVKSLNEPLILNNAQRDEVLTTLHADLKLARQSNNAQSVQLSEREEEFKQLFLEFLEREKQLKGKVELKKDYMLNSCQSEGVGTAED